MAARQMHGMDRLRGRLLYHEPMARHTSWRVGGAADRYFEPADLDDLGTFLVSIGDAEPLLWVGLGSNLLVREGGVRGTVINTAHLDKTQWLAEGLLRAEAGVPCAKVARITVRAGFTGAEFLCGIPGTVGGALAMNAGAFGGETWSVVEHIETIDRAGHRQRRMREEFAVGYRAVATKVEECFVAGVFRVRADPERRGEARIRELLARRNRTQPTGQPSCGSVFRNPPGDFAGRLIEACGLKGTRVGGALVSEKHANFIVSDASATAADIEALIDLVRRRVREEHGIDLLPEVRVVGEAHGRGERA
ncbi:MAG: UDP-N-acetylmuramate dehydrogenase [Chromatiales bacterium]